MPESFPPEKYGTRTCYVVKNELAEKIILLLKENL